MFFKKEATNASLLAAIDSGSLDNVLKSGKLISDQAAVSDSDREVIRRINDKAAEIMTYAAGESGKLNMVNEIIHSGMWKMYFDTASGEINRINWSDEFRRMIGFRNQSDFPSQHRGTERHGGDHQPDNSEPGRVTRQGDGPFVPQCCPTTLAQGSHDF